jgi:integrase
MASIQNRTKDGRGFVVHYRDPSGKQRTQSFKSEKEAKQFAAGVETDKVRGLFIAPTGGRVKLGERWAIYEKSSVDLRNSTRARNSTYARTHILPRFENVRIGDISKDDVQEWVNGLVASGLAPATVQKLYQLLARLLQDAVDARLIASTPCVRIKLPKSQHVEQRFLEPHEVELLSNCIDERFRVWVMLAAYSGLRAGELFGLRRSRLNLTAGKVSVQETLVDVNGTLEWHEPKTRAGRREVPLPRFLVDELLEQTAGLVPDDLVFEAPYGGPIRLGNFRRRVWAPAIADAGLEPLRIHDLRHTAVAFWIAAGASPKEIAVRAGHRSVVTVLDRYGHLLQTSEDHVTSALDAMARGVARASKPGGGDVVQFGKMRGA